MHLESVIKQDDQTPKEKYVHIFSPMCILTYDTYMYVST